MDMNDTGTNAFINAANTIGNTIANNASAWTGKDYATVAALLFGPVLAIWVAEILRKREEFRKRQIHVFRNLMATRTITMNFKHIEALNIVELEFYDHRKVMDCWRLYRTHLDDTAYSKRDIAAWENDRAKLMVDLLYEMSISLGLSYDKSDIQKGVYYPKGYADTEQQQLELRKLLLQLLRGERQLPMRAEVYPIQPPHPPAETEPPEVSA